MSIIQHNITIILHHQLCRLGTMSIGFGRPYGFVIMPINDQVSVTLHDKAEGSSMFVVSAC